MATVTRQRVQEGLEHLHPRQRTALSSWLAFTTTFGVVRGITYGIRYNVGPFRNVSLGGEHVHHYVWGIILLAAAGGLSLQGEAADRPHHVLGSMYGAGGALVVDEFALLLDLKDVYWAKEGRISVDAAVGLIGVVGSYFAAIPFWHHLARRRVPDIR